MTASAGKKKKVTCILFILLPSLREDFDISLPCLYCILGSFSMIYLCVCVCAISVCVCIAHFVHLVYVLDYNVHD